MSRIMNSENTCAVCGHSYHYTECCSSFAFGSPDLDLRPSEMARSTMKYWVQKCPFCGYVAETVSDPCPVEPRFLWTAAYRFYGGRLFLSRLAKRFYRQYLIAKEAGDDSGACMAALHAAWACDDAHDARNAKYCRKLALQHLDCVLREDDDDAPGEEWLLLRADLLRRTRQFSEVIRIYRKMRFSDETMNTLRRFEVSMARRKNSRCFTEEEAIQFMTQQR